MTTSRPILTLALLALLPLSACKQGWENVFKPKAAEDTHALTTSSTIGGGTLFSGLGNHQRKVTTTSKETQKFFNQGLIWAYAFNHDEAIRSFAHAARLDPDCAMAWWGVALCNGPHINNPVMDPDRSRRASDALDLALARINNTTPVEAALINALAKRYQRPAPADRAPLDKAYADAMRAVYSDYPNDPDVGTLFAESMMDLRPWDLWTQAGDPQPGTDEIVAALETVMRIDPDHPGANHLYIHAIEASPYPGKATAAADRLRTLVPAAGHLVHMPAHIDARTGRWQLASEANVKAIAADAAYRKIAPKQGFYHVYMAHNHHFLCFASMMEGRKTVALNAARDMIAGVPEQFIVDSAALVDPVSSIMYDVQKRFGMWDEILKEPKPDSRLPITTALWHYTRGLAFAAKADIPSARAEQSAMRAKVSSLSPDTMMTINPADKVMNIADLVLEAEIALAEGRIDESVRDLRAAVTIEDTLRYMEPPDWIQPVRHTLGAVLVSAGRHDEAQEVYREDLKRWPENAWSLLGLSQCLQSTGHATAQELSDIKSRTTKAWSRADYKPGSSCACVKGRAQ